MPDSQEGKTDLLCQKIGALLSSYIDGELTEFQCAEVEQHLEYCSPCTQTLSEQTLLSVQIFDALQGAEPDVQLCDRLQSSLAVLSPPWYLRKGPILTVAAMLIFSLTLNFALGPGHMDPNLDPIPQKLTDREIADPSPFQAVPALAKDASHASIETPIPPSRSPNKTVADISPKEDHSDRHFVTNPEESKFVVGDVDGNGVFDLADMKLLAAAIDHPDKILNRRVCIAAGDFDGDNELTPADYSNALSQLFGVGGEPRLSTLQQRPMNSTTLACATICL